MDEDKLQQGNGGNSSGILKLHEITEPEREYYAQAEALRQARVRFAQAFQIAKAKGGSDALAQQAAIEMTQAELTIYEAALKVAEERLQ